MVPKAQYDALMKKYTELENKSKAAPAAPVADAQNLVNELEKAPVKDIEVQNTLMETVDVFDPKGAQVVTPLVAGKSASEAIDSLSSGEGKIENEIAELKKAMGMAGQGKYDTAIKMLQGLSKSSSNKQIQVRAKFGTGEVLLAQKEYDLAMQVYEDIINNHVYSGLVLNALKRAITCSEELKLTDKKARYESLLKDVFGT